MAEEPILHSSTVDDDLEETLITEARNERAGFATLQSITKFTDAILDVEFELPYGGETFTIRALRARYAPHLTSRPYRYDVLFESLLAASNTTYAHPERILGAEFPVEPTSGEDETDAEWAIAIPEASPEDVATDTLREDYTTPDQFDADVFEDILTVQNNTTHGFAYVETVTDGDEKPNHVTVRWSLPTGDETITRTFARRTASGSSDPPLSLFLDAVNIEKDDIQSLGQVELAIEYAEGEWRIPRIDSRIDEYEQANESDSSSSRTETRSSSSSGVSSIIGMVITVGVLILLVALIGSTAVETVDSISTMPQASVTFADGDAAHTVSVTAVTMENAELLRVQYVEDGEIHQTERIQAVGETVELEGQTGTVKVYAVTDDGATSLMQTYDLRDSG